MRARWYYNGLVRWFVRSGLSVPMKGYLRNVGQDSLSEQGGLRRPLAACVVVLRSYLQAPIGTVSH